MADELSTAEVAVLARYADLDLSEQRLSQVTTVLSGVRATLAALGELDEQLRDVHPASTFDPRSVQR